MKYFKLSCLLVPVLLFLPAKAQTIWFSPRFGSSDYMDLFQTDAPWQNAASQVKVFSISSAKLMDPSVEKDLPNILADLRRRHIALDIGLLPLTGMGEGHCGYRIEGYSAPGQPLSYARRLKAAGADVGYFSMDEPLYYGHVSNLKGTCHTPIADLAKDVALKVKQVQSVYPGVGFGDVEPMGIPDANWLADLEQWFDAYQAATGQPLAFFRVDMQWNGPYWQGQMQQLGHLLQRKGIPLQVIYNGAGNAGSDETWIAQTIRHFEQYETNGLPHPDAVNFQCWTPNPTHNLPESDPRTLTGLIDQYVQWKKSKP